MVPLDCTLAETRYSSLIQFKLNSVQKNFNYPARGNFVLFIAVPASDAAKAHDKNPVSTGPDTFRSVLD